MNKFSIILLAGEDNKVKEKYRTSFGFKRIVTTGFSQDADLFWNFEHDIPKGIGKFDLIISQAILEHIIDPFKHISDLSKLLKPNGFLIVQTVIPGFGYHRVPIDCFRFYPDWFEEVAKRLELKVVDKGIYHAQICYKFSKKPKNSKSICISGESLLYKDFPEMEVIEK